MTEPKKRRLQRPLRFVRNRFSPQGYLGLHLTIGVLIILFSAWCFSEIAEDLEPSAGLIAFDEQVIAWFQGEAQPALTVAARAISFLGSVGFLTVASLLGGAVLIRIHGWNRLLALSLTMIGGGLLNVVLKHFFQRDRPVLENPLVTLTSFGFPSGHTMGSTIFYGLIALIIGQRLAQKRWRIAVAFAACLVIAAIGLTRIYLGAHYLSDVLAAVAAGVVWLTFCWTAIEIFRRRRRDEELEPASPPQSR